MTKWKCTVCGDAQKTMFGNCTIERSIPAELPYMCPWQSFDKRGNKDTVPAKWVLVD